MLSEFRRLAEDIKERAQGKTVVYIPNPGNWGDGLIRYGTKLFFEDFGIRHLEVNIGYRFGKVALAPFLSPDYIRKCFFVYGGGGAWGAAYSGGLDTVKFLAKFTRDFCVLPSTYEIPVNLKGGVFYSRGLTQSMKACPNALFCHDMALYIATKPDHLTTCAGEKVKQIGVFFRQDKESRDIAFARVFAGSRDISAEGDHMSNGDSFIRTVSRHDQIFTDRLHVAIAGCIANCEVRLAPGNYFKIGEVFESSLANIFGKLTIDTDFESFKATLRLALSESEEQIS